MKDLRLILGTTGLLLTFDATSLPINDEPIEKLFNKYMKNAYNQGRRDGIDEALKDKETV